MPSDFIPGRQPNRCSIRDGASRTVTPPAGGPARFRKLLPLLSVLLFPVVLWGQQSPVQADTMFRHAHRLVSQGQGEAGRAMVDSLLRETPAMTPAYAEGLFWRAVTAARAEDAERDYLRIVIEYPLSPRAEDALIRLAELEMMRGDRVRAQRHLQRLIIEHPRGQSRARASYWLARVYFEGNDLPRACNELNVARIRAAPADVELRNQVEYHAQRCAGVEVVAPVAPAPTGTAVAQTPPPTTASVATPPPDRTAAATPPAGVQQPGVPAGGGALPAPPAATRPAPPASTRTAPGFSVQVAAFPTKPAADSFRESLAARGYDVRVWGTANPFRVRVGRFATRAEAAELAQELRTRMIARDAYVVEAEVR